VGGSFPQLVNGDKKEGEGNGNNKKLATGGEVTFSGKTSRKKTGSTAKIKGSRRGVFFMVKDLQKRTLGGALDIKKSREKNDRKVAIFCATTIKY